MPLIARHLLTGLSARHGRGPMRLEQDAAELLMEQQWPGNVRQLANLLERAVILAEGRALVAADLKNLLAETDRRDERERLRQALRESGGDKKEAARRLGMSYSTLLRRIKAHDLEGYPKYRD